MHTPTQRKNCTPWESCTNCKILHPLETSKAPQFSRTIKPQKWSFFILINGKNFPLWQAIFQNFRLQQEFFLNFCYFPKLFACGSYFLKISPTAGCCQVMAHYTRQLHLPGNSAPPEILLWIRPWFCGIIKYNILNVTFRVMLTCSLGILLSVIQLLSGSSPSLSTLKFSER